MYKAIAANKRNTVIIMIVFFVLIGGLAWFVSYYYGDWDIAIYAVSIAAIYALIQYFAAGRLAMTVNGAHEISKKDNPTLWNTVENIAITEGLPMPRVFLIDDPAPNAFATGRNPKSAMVAATTGLIDIMDKRELAAVMAHEMGHVRNYDILVSMIVFGLVSAISLVSDIILRMTFFGRGSSDNKSPYVLIIGIIAVVIAPIVALLVQLAVSRQREYLADASSAMTTRDPDGMIMALEKLKANGRPMRRQNTSTAHLFLNNPLKKGFFNKIFSTHPPLDERIARLKKHEARF
ncbi:MAG: M48 family metalloprotease [Candidatus Nomurabacteria bacterium]|jgi:heat shock protein HtpX|nr:M48 family metalloprotease [Candidatus Nomurabacteria bacterium]